MLYSQFEAELPKFPRGETLGIIRYQNLGNREAGKYFLFEGLNSRCSGGVPDRNLPTNLEKASTQTRIATLASLTMRKFSNIIDESLLHLSFCHL
jgi:hypothetical protein